MPKILRRVARNIATIVISSSPVDSVYNVKSGRFIPFENQLIEILHMTFNSYARTTLSIPAATYATLLSLSPAMDTRELSAI